MSQSRWTLQVNGRRHEVDAAADTPLLYILQNDLQLKGPRFGCGLAQCGSCSVLLEDREVRACVTPISAVAGRAVTTLEGIPAWYARKEGLRRAPAMHPVQQALVDEQAPQCGYCMNGMVVKAAELLAARPNPDEAEIRNAMNGHLCRCGTYPSILRAIRKAAQTMDQT
jgi:aerobic-type carbon monoxide dehydrogenase small subunit (CoxS/CutS family)